MKKVLSLGLICLLSLSLSSAIFSSAVAQADPGSTGRMTIQYLLEDPAIQRGADTLTTAEGSVEV